MNDTRKDDRLLVALVMRYREPTMLEPREGECRDLSPSGMFIGTARPSPRGALIRFESVSDKVEDAFRGTGRVVWQRPKPDDRGPAGMGVRFVRLEAGGREAVERTMERIGKPRPISRTPRPNGATPPSSRARLEEAPTQAIPIFAAGGGGGSTSVGGSTSAGAESSPKAATSSAAPSGGSGADAASPATPNGAAAAASSSPAAAVAGSAAASVATVAAGAGALPSWSTAVTTRPPAPESTSSGTSQFPQLRAATLRGIPRQGDPKRPSNPLAGPSRSHSQRPASLGSTRPGLSPLPPAPKRNVGASDELRHRLGRTRRGVGPSELAEEAEEAEVTEVADTKGASQPAPHDNAAGDRTTQPGGTGTDAAAAGDDKPAREPHSDRPPRPGGTDDLRPRIPSGQNGAPRSPVGSPFARTMIEGRGEDWPPLRPRALAADNTPRAEHDETERRIPILNEAERERYSSPDFDQPRTNSRALFWVIAGTGLVMSFATIRLFGGVLPGLPDGTETEKTSKPSAGDTGTTPNAANAASPAPHALTVITKPTGARVTAAGQTVIAPGTLRIDDLQGPVQVIAELTGYNKATTTVSAAAFERKGDAYEGRIELTLEPVVKLAAATQTTPATATPTAATPVSTQTQAAKPREHERATAPRRSTASRTPSRTPHRTPIADPPAPSVSDEIEKPEVVVSERPAESASPNSDSDSQQTPLAQALDCLARGDNRCVIRALEDKANSAREYELLIETYRAVGSTPRAEKQMQHYLERFPDGQRAGEYRRLLERRAPSGTPAPAPEAAD